MKARIIIKPEILVLCMATAIFGWIPAVSSQTERKDGAKILVTQPQSYYNSSSAYSPDGKKIAMVSFQKEEISNLFMVDMESGESKELTDYREKYLHALYPTWTPDGKWITYFKWLNAQTIEYTPTIRSVSVDGKEDRVLVKLGDRDRIWGMSWSRDGKRLAIAMEENLVAERLVQRSIGIFDGSSLRRIATFKYNPRAMPPRPGEKHGIICSPQWLSNNEIAFLDFQLTESKLIRVNVDEENAEPKDWLILDKGPNPDVARVHLRNAFRLSPDCQRIAYAMCQYSGFDIFVQPVNSEKAVRLTRDGGLEPTWHPSGKRIAFTNSGKEKLICEMSPQ